MADTTSSLPEFIFGDLSTDQGRLKHARLARVGLFHDSTLIPLIPQEDEPIQIKVHVGADIAIKTMTLYYSTDDSALKQPINLEHPAIVSLPMQRSEIEWDTLQWGYLEQWCATLPGQRNGTQVRYVIRATSTTDQTLYCPYLPLDSLQQFDESIDSISDQSAKIYHDNQPQVYGFIVDDQSIPEWLRAAVIYQIFVDRFAPDPGADFQQPEDRSGIYGGTLKGIIGKLDYLQDLGVTCLWLTPIFPSPSHHGYDPTDYGAIEHRLGTLEDWQYLVDEAHQRDIHIVLDYVANHLSSQHAAFQSAIGDPNHPTVEWFRFRNYPIEYDCFFDVPGQPELNSDHPEVRNYFITHACQWLQKGCDGFRLDYAHGVSHAFWSQFRAATRRIKPDSATFGEITQPPSVMRSFAGRMDGCLDFKLLELLRGFFAFGSLKVSQFDKALGQHFAYFGTDLVLPSFLDNHDMNRFLWTVDGDKRRLKLAALCQFTLTNPPIIYYGTEVGLSQLTAVGRLEESRLPMIWGDRQDTDLLEFYKQLISLRLQNPGLWHQIRQPWIIDDTNQVYGYAWDSCLIVLNNHNQDISLSLPNWKEYGLAIATNPLTVWDRSISELILPPYGGVILSLVNHK
jgi:cyclomaltodextrinase / maltogenic alpha-amylase / neopullulanase